MPEGNTSVTLHDDTWNKITTMLHMEQNPTADVVAKNIEIQVPHLETEPEPDYDEVAVGFCGLPGSGKSKAAELLVSLMTKDCANAAAISMGDAIRTEYERRYDEEYDSGDLADFAANARAEDPSQIPQWVTDLANESEADYFAIDGVRSITDYEVLSKFFDKFLLVHIEAPFYERLRRIRGRGREGEGGFDPGDLVKRDGHEYDDLGFRGLLEGGDDWADSYLPNQEYNNYDTGYIDTTIDNSYSLERLEKILASVLADYDWLPNPASRAGKTGGRTPQPKT